MPSKTIQYTTRDSVRCDGYLSKPDGNGPFPGILLITAIFGVDDEMKELADAWAADGFIVSVPDIFFRVLPGPLPVSEFETAIGRMHDFDRDQGLEDIEDLINDLKSRPECDGKVGMLGFCFGGRYVHLAAALLGIDAGATFHGTTIGEELGLTEQISCPMSLHFGGVDEAVPLEEVERIQAAYHGKANCEIAVYDGVGHNFAMPQKPGYDEAAAKTSRAAALRTFQSM